MKAAGVNLGASLNDPANLQNLDQAVNYDDSDRSGLPQIQNLWQDWDTPISPPLEIIEGILAKGSKLLIGSVSKARKTWLLIHLALSIASGKNWLNRKVQRGGVLYLNFELKPETFKRRAQQIAAKCGISPAEVERFDVWNLRGFGQDFDELLPRILEVVRRGNYLLLVIDPIYKCLGNRNENDAGDIGDLVNQIEKLVAETGVSVAYSHHFSKGNKSRVDAIDRVSGSGVWSRDSDAILTLTPHETPEAFTVEAEVREFAPVRPFVVEWVYPVFVVNGELEPTRLKKAGAVTRRTVDEILSLLSDRGLRSTEWRNLAKSEQGIGESRFYELLKEAKSKSLVRSEEGRYFRA